MPRRGEAEVVAAEPLATILREWIEQWSRERPLNYEDFAWRLMTPLEWLSENTGITKRRISGISKGEFPRIPLSQADAILTAIGQNHRLLTDVVVIRNPTWSLEQWIEYMQERGCCG